MAQPRPAGTAAAKELAAAPSTAPASPEPASPLPSSAWAKKAVKTVLDFLIEQWFVIGIGIVILLAHFFPNVGRTGGSVRAEYTVKFLLVALIFFILGLTVPLINIYKRALDWKLHIATQFTSFFVTPAIIFAIVSCVRAADPNFETFDRWALVGMVVMGVLPTTVSSNVVMTGQSGGDQAAATIEVLIGNLVGTFLSPALLQAFLSGSDWAFGQPKASGPGGTQELYRQVAEQLGCTVFVPLFIGELIQWIAPVFVKKWRLKLRLAKFGSLCLLGVIWATFCNAFYNGAFQAMSGQTIALVVGVNIFLYILFAIFLFVLARLVPMPGFLQRSHPVRHSSAGGIKESDRIGWEDHKLFDAEVTIALMFCGAAKGIVLGGPLVQIMYGGLSPVQNAIVQIPLVLWQGTQVVAGQVQVAILRSWARQVKAKNARLKLLQEEEEPAESEDGTIHPDPRGEDRAAGKAGEAAEAAMSKEELGLEHQQPAAAKYLDEKV